jgi:hypothetical protein
MSRPSVYLAASAGRREEMLGVRDVLAPLGYLVTSRWIDRGVTVDIRQDPMLAACIAAEAVQDIQAAELLLCFTTGNGGSNGGRQVELGIAYALGKRCIVVGPPENVFHTLLEQVPDWPRLVMLLARASWAGGVQDAVSPGGAT